MPAKRGDKRPDISNISGRAAGPGQGQAGRGAEKIGMMLDDGLLICNFDGRVLSANPAAVRLLNNHLQDQMIAQIIAHPEMARLFDQPGQPVEAFEFVWIYKTQVTQEFRVRVHQLDQQRIAILLLDMTLQKNLEKVRRDFVANVSHELRSPLTTLAGFIETLQESRIEDAATVHRFLGIMDEEAQRMKRLIDDLLSLSRVEAMEHIVPVEKLPLIQLVRSVCATLAPRAARNDMAIIWDGAESVDLTSLIIAGQSDEIIELFDNLIENAIKYGQPGTDVTVKVSRPDDKRIRIAIINQGDGIEAQHINRLTERFYRVDKARSRQLGGTGLGLAIVKHIINKHRGQLEISSEPGGQTVFAVSLPLLAAAASQKQDGQKTVAGPVKKL